MIQYPAELPLPLQEGYGLNTADPMRATPMVTGRTRYRIRHRRTPTSASFSFNFDEEEAALFEGWYEWSINLGLEWFEMPLQTPLGLQVHLVHFKRMYGGGELAQIKRWRFTAELEFKKRPVYTEDQYLGAALGMPLGQFNDGLQGSLEKWYTRYFG
ncbi:MULTISPECIES: transposase [Pseudomonas]|uniref:transposase n=1 Tax=Pseudomonas TaxID=286 RepID=UPI000CFEE811|nr:MULTISPECIES: transposase [Pseudomonas]PRA53166.1 transposase [Pseudomonas sp. MYb115]QXN52232.1 transposase [Pseudomonas fluorescens]WSO26563.1 transposase [Pseudomonas fluorescens]